MKPSLVRRWKWVQVLHEAPAYKEINDMEDKIKQAEKDIVEGKIKSQKELFKEIGKKIRELVKEREKRMNKEEK